VSLGAGSETSAEREGRRRAALLHERLARALLRSAALADHHAVMHERAGRAAAAARERAAATRARNAAERAQRIAADLQAVAEPLR
jgi:hypothetical protein